MTAQNALSLPVAPAPTHVLASVEQLDPGQQSAYQRSCTQKPHMLSGSRAADQERRKQTGLALRHHDPQVVTDFVLGIAAFICAPHSVVICVS